MINNIDKGKKIIDSLRIKNILGIIVQRAGGQWELINTIANN